MIMVGDSMANTSEAEKVSGDTYDVSNILVINCFCLI